MYKRPFISFASIFVFWIVISGTFDLEHIAVGIFLSMLLVWFWKDFNPRLPSTVSLKETMLFARCILMLIGYVIKSNIEVAKILLFSKKCEPPIFLEMDVSVESNWGKVFLATCITITPGTITIDIDPETNMFSVHALTREMGVSLYYWSIITEIQHLERLIHKEVN